MGEMRAFLLLIALLLPVAGFAEASKSKIPAFQLGSVFPDPAGILFPGPATAAAINPAVLGNSKGTVAQAAFGPGLRSGDPHHYFGSFATAKKKFGMGFGIDGLANGGGNFTNGGFVGMGFNLERIALGLGVRDANVSDSIGPSVDVGCVIGEGQGLTGGFVLYHLESSPQAALGIGFNGGKKYNLELNVVLPRFNSFSGGGYGLSIGANLFIDLFSFLFRTTYYTSPRTYVHTLGIGIWLNQSFNVGVQLNTPREWTLGVTVVF